MGEVFLAREEEAGRACVVKKVLPTLAGNEQFLARFRDEARVVRRLSHPNIARVWAMGDVAGELYLAMEYVAGKTLNRLAWRLRNQKRTLPLGLALLIGERMCQGLAYAHDVTDEQGQPLHLVHRDLSPANVCISYGGEVKIIDFGAAQSTLKEAQTAPSVVMGSITYMAPEQARKKRVDRRADVYATGVLLWELLAWHPIKQEGDVVQRWRRAAYPQWEPPGRHRPSLPPEVDAVVMKALAAEPEERFVDAAAFGAALRGLREVLAPGVGDADLARLMAEAFEREKAVEDGVLAELLRGKPALSRPLTEKELPAFAPPTAMAFEHRALDAPPDFVPSAEVELLEDPVSAGTDSGAGGLRHAGARRGRGRRGPGPGAPGPGARGPGARGPASAARGPAARAGRWRLAQALARRGAVPRRARGGLPRGVVAGVIHSPCHRPTREFRHGAVTFTE
jgi:serine/threonine-protein kinase